MISAIIVEDSRLARMELKELLKVYPQIQVIAEAGSAPHAAELIKVMRPELLFLDIHLQGKSGFDLLQELDKVPLVIFTTAFDQYALQAFDYPTVDYLLKPVVPEHLKRAIGKAEAQITKVLADKTDEVTATDRIFVKDGNKCWFVNLSEIRLLESKGNYTQIHFGSHAPLMLKSLQQMDAMLDQQRYVRINRQQIVNTSFVKTVTMSFTGILQLQLSTGEILKASRRQASRIKSLFSF
jgi:two-component system LytT family response regulator